MRALRIVAAVGLLSVAVLVPRAEAQELKMALSAEPSSMDPHYHNLTPNNALGSHIFDRLVHNDEQQRPVPGLAVSWRLVDPTTWEFKLRPGVKWHDGSPFTADDVLFTMERAQAVPNSPGGFGIYIKGKTFTRIDDLTIQVKTAGPAPLMVNDMSTIMIVSKKHASGAQTPDFNSGKAAVGTGPFRFKSYVAGEKAVFERNDGYWGNKAAWKTVTLRPIKAGPARVAALLAGDVDVIEEVPTTDIARLKGEAKVALSQGLSNRVIYFHMDQFRDVTPFITGKDGKEIKNPLKDKRVRQALTMAINRDALVSRVMDGAAVKASQFLADGFFGISPKLKPVAFNAEGAKKLLADAGHTGGFKMKLHGPSGRYINDARLIEIVAQMFARIGIETSVETLPPAVFFSRASAGAGGLPEFSFILVGWGSGTGENSSPLKSIVTTFDKSKGNGPANRGRYSNAEVDRLVGEALRTVDDTKRGALLAQATEVAIEDVAIIPTHYQVNTWGVRRGLAYRARSDEYTVATEVTEAKK